MTNKQNKNNVSINLKPMKNQNDSTSAFCYHVKETGLVSPVANALGPGFDMEKYITSVCLVLTILAK